MAAEPVAQPALASEPTDASVIADARQRMEHLEWHALMLQQRQQLLLVQHQMLLDAAAALHDSMQEQDHGGHGDTEHAAMAVMNVVCASHAQHAENSVLPFHQAG